MTLTAYTRRASYGDGDWKSRHCITQPLSNYFRAAPENSRKLRNITLYSTCSSAQHPSLRLIPSSSIFKAQPLKPKPQNRPRLPWAHKPPDGLLGAHERNGAVLLQNAAPTPLGTHEHSRVHFLILGSGLPGVGGEDPPAQPLLSGSGNQGRILPHQIRKMCVLDWAGARSRGDPFPRCGLTKSSRGRVYWSHTKRTALFCCRTWP